MSDFPGRFVKLCGSEPALWHPGHSDGLLAAIERIAAAIDWAGYRPKEVKPLFDSLRALYEEDVKKGGKSKLRWFDEMDAYLGPLVRGETSTSTRNARIEDSVNNMEIDADVPCDVCRSPYPEDKNEMIFCDSCNVCVHQACYGVITVPEDDWLCRPCAINVNPTCILCPKKGGALKCTSDGQKWAHVSCVWWIKKVRFGNPELMEPIKNISRIPVSSWNLVCSLCKQRTGACIQCVINYCKVAFHVTCAFDKGLKMDMVEDSGADGVKLLSYCRKHSETNDSSADEKETIKEGNLQKGRSGRSNYQERVPHHLQQSNEIGLFDSDSECLETDSTFDGSDLSSESNSSSSPHTDNSRDSSFNGTSHSSDQNSESSSTFSSSNSTTARTRLEQKKPDRCLAPESRPNCEGKLSSEQEITPTRTRLEPIHKKMSGETSPNKLISAKNVAEAINGIFNNMLTDVKTKASLDRKFLSDQQSLFRMQEQILYNNCSPENVYEHFLEGEYTDSTPITHKNNCGNLPSTLLDETIQSSTNLASTTAPQGTSQSKSSLQTSTKVIRPKRIDNLTPSTENKYLFASDTYSTPMTQINNYETIASTLLDENIQSSINPTSATQGALQSKSNLLTLTEETRPKKIDNLTPSTESKYLSASDTYSTPMTQINNCETLASTLLDENIQFSINPTSATQGASQSKSNLLTLTQEIRPKKIDNSTLSTESKYLSASDTYSTPMTQINNCETLASTLLDENIQSSINATSATQGASQSKSNLLTLTQEIRPKKIDNLTPSTESKYLSASDTYSTPMTQINNCETLASTLLDENIQSSINATSATQGASQSKSNLLTLTQEIRPKKIDNSTLSTESKYLSASDTYSTPMTQINNCETLASTLLDENIQSSINATSATQGASQSKSNLLTLTQEIRPKKIDNSTLSTESKYLSASDTYPMTQINNYETLASTLLDENIQSSINATSATQGASQSKSNLLTLTQEIRPKKIDNSTLSTESKYLSASDTYPMTQINNCETLASTLLDENIQSSINATSATQGALQSKSNLLTLTQEIRPKKIDNSTLSTESKYLSASDTYSTPMTQINNCETLASTLLDENIQSSINATSATQGASQSKSNLLTLTQEIRPKKIDNLTPSTESKYLSASDTYSTPMTQINNCETLASTLLDENIQSSINATSATQGASQSKSNLLTLTQEIRPKKIDNSTLSTESKYLSASDTYSTPMTQINNCETLASTLLDENIQSSINATSATQGASQSKSNLLTLTQEIRPKKIDNSTLSTESKYLSASDTYPMTQINNYETLASTLLDENIQSSINATSATQGASQSKSNLLTLTQEIRPKKIDNSTLSTESKYLSASDTYPMTQINNCETLASTLLDENIQSSINATSATQGALQSKSNLLTLTQETRPKKIDNLTLSTESEYLSASDTYSTPMTQINNCEKLASTFLDENIQPSINLTTAPQEASQSKSNLITSTQSSINLTTAPQGASQSKSGKASNLTSPTKNEYLSATEIDHQASCNYDIPSTSQLTPQKSLVTHPHEATNGQMSRDQNVPLSEDEYQHLVATINNTKSLLMCLTEKKKHYRNKRKIIDSTSNSDDSSDASSSIRNEKKRLRKDSIQTQIADQSPSSERNEHYIQFSKVIATVLKSIPPAMAATLENKIITMCLKSHKQWQQIKFKNT